MGNVEFQNVKDLFGVPAHGGCVKVYLVVIHGLDQELPYKRSEFNQIAEFVDWAPHMVDGPIPVVESDPRPLPKPTLHLKLFAQPKLARVEKSVVQVQD